MSVDPFLFLVLAMEELSFSFYVLVIYEKLKRNTFSQPFLPHSSSSKFGQTRIGYFANIFTGARAISDYFGLAKRSVKFSLGLATNFGQAKAPKLSFHYGKTAP